MCLGISQLTQCGQVDSLPELPEPDEQRLQRAAYQLQQRLVLRQWLARHNLQQHYARLLGLEVASLEDVYWLEDSKARQALGKDLAAWAGARQALPTSRHFLHGLKAELWSEVVKSSEHQDAWTWGGMLVVSVSVAGLVTLAAMTQPSLAPEAKHSLLQYVTGKYLLPANCTVLFHWPDPAPVGQTVCFTVRFYQRNGQPYPICDTDQLCVEVCEGARKIATISELGSPIDPSCANVARVKFTVRHAGRYCISVVVDAHHVPGSPFARTFVAGPADAHRSLVLRHCSTVVCTASVSHLLHVEPRDEYSNVCSFQPGEDPTNGYTVAVSQLGGRSADGYTAALDYDWQAHKINVQLKFVYEGCYHATIKYRGVVLHNGDFDIIVLNSKTHFP